MLHDGQLSGGTCESTLELLPLQDWQRHKMKLTHEGVLGRRCQRRHKDRAGGGTRRGSGRIMINRFDTGADTRTTAARVSRWGGDTAKLLSARGGTPGGCVSPRWSSQSDSTSIRFFFAPELLEARRRWRRRRRLVLSGCETRGVLSPHGTAVNPLSVTQESGLPEEIRLLKHITRSSRALR